MALQKKHESYVIIGQHENKQNQPTNQPANQPRPPDMSWWDSRKKELYVVLRQQFIYI